MLVDLSGKLQVYGAARLLPVGLDARDGLLHRAVVPQVCFQCLFFRPLGSVGPVTFGGFLHAVDVGVLSPAYPHLLEVAASLVVVQCINGKYLLPLHGGQSQYGGYLLVPVLELGLVEQYLHVGIIYDGLLHDGRVYHVVQLLRDHPGDAVELADGLVQVLDVLRHRGRGDGLPRLFDYQGLAPFLDAHLLEEHVHDDEHHDGEKHGVVLYLVNFKDDETLIEEVHVQVGVQRRLQFAAPVELLEDGGEAVYVERDFLQGGDLRDALHGELVVGVEGQLPDLQPPFLFLHAVYLPVNPHQHGVLVKLPAVFLHDMCGVFPFRLRGGLVAHEGHERTTLADELHAPDFRGEQQGAAFRHLRRLLGVYQAVDVLHLVVVLLVVVVHPGVYEQLLTQLPALLLREFLERMEIGVVILHDGLVDYHVLYLAGERAALEDEEHQRFEEVLLLAEVQPVFLLRDLEGVHGDGLLLGIGDVRAAVVAADALIGVARVHHDHIRLLLQQLADDRVHMTCMWKPFYIS